MYETWLKMEEAFVKVYIFISSFAQFLNISVKVQILKRYKMSCVKHKYW